MMKSFKLKVGFFALIFACSCIFFGCGSDNNSGVSVSRKDQKSPVKQKRQVQVKELLPNGPPGASGTTKPIPLREREALNLEVTPPDKPGGVGVTQQEIEAAMRTSKQIAPQDIEITPPSKSGGRGITQQEIEAAMKTMKASKMTNPQDIEVLPPNKPGEHGVTQRQVDALKPTQEIDPQTIEVIPPGKLGGHSVTQQEIDKIRASQKEFSDEASKPPPLPQPQK